MSFRLNTDISNYNWPAIKKYYFDFCFHCAKLFREPKRKLLADLLTLQRLYNSYAWEAQETGGKLKEIYRNAIELVWNCLEGVSFYIPKAKEFAQCIDDVIMAYNCGEPIPDEEREFCRRYFPDLLGKEDTIHGNSFERVLLTALGELLEVILNNRGYQGPSIAGHSTLPLAENLIYDDLNVKISNSDTDPLIFSHPWFIEELKAVQQDMLNALQYDVHKAANIQRLKEVYQQKLFLSAKLKPVCHPCPDPKGETDHHSKSDPQPPWIRYPNTDPTWGGWRQGTGEAWLVSLWLPFLKQLTPEERDAYLKKWPAPSDEWAQYVTELWR